MRENKKLYFWKAYFHTVLASFISFVIYNSFYEKLILEFTGIKVIYQAMILKVILKVGKLGKIQWCTIISKSFSNTINAV